MTATIVSAVAATVTILLAIGGLYATLNKRISDVSDTLSNRIADVSVRLARIEGRLDPWLGPPQKQAAE